MEEVRHLRTRTLYTFDGAKHRLKKKIGLRKRKDVSVLIIGAEAVTMNYFMILMLKFLKIIRGVVDCFSHICFNIINRGKKEVLPPITNLILLESATSLSRKIRTGKLKSVEVVESFIARIQEVNPILNCITDERFEDALKEAEQVDRLIQSKTKDEKTLFEEMPFLGVPFTSKDSIGVTGQKHTVGLVLRKDCRAATDAEVISCLRKAGAIPVAKTNVSELCIWWESSNNIFGRTNNPYDVTRIVGGSSGGEASLLAAAGSPVGLGSDIGGSIRMPAFFNGIFGHKPTTGIVSNEGQLPVTTGEWNTFLVTGPMSRFSSDLLPMLKVLADKHVTKLKLDTSVNIKKLKYYYMEDDGGFPLISPVHPELKAAQKKIIVHLDKAYGIKAQKVHLKKMYKSLDIWSHKMTNDTEETSLCELLAEGKSVRAINPLIELLKWCLWISPHTLPAIGLGLLENVREKHSEDHTRIINICHDLLQEFQELLGDDGVFLYPSHPTPALHHNEPLFKMFNFAYTAIFNVLGLPVTQCPLGLGSWGVPLGIQVVGALYNDHLTLAVATELEKAFGGWVSPSQVL